MSIQSRLGELRRRRGVPVAKLAASAGVSRQTIYSIEDGSFVPNTAVALALAKILETTVEELFVEAEPREQTNCVEALLLMPDGLRASTGQLVQLCQVEGRNIAVAASEGNHFLPYANGVLQHQTGRYGSVRYEGPVEESHVLIAGCDPALGLLSGAVLLNCSSRRALDLLKEGAIHIAGCHIQDPSSGNYNTMAIHSIFRKGEVRLFTFASWEQGLVLQRHNPKRIRSVSDLARKDVRVGIREPGSGSRDLLEAELVKAAIDPRIVIDKGVTAYGHLAVAELVQWGAADCGVVSRAAARFFGLDFISLRQDRFDLAIRTSMLGSPVVKRLIDEVSTLRLRHQLTLFAGYETSHTGDLVM